MSTKKAFAKITKTNKIRGCDASGCGHFGAGRGTRLHDGVDIVVIPGETITSPISGKVIKHPYVYPGDLKFRGIDIENETYLVRMFYLSPSVAVGLSVNAGQPIGIAQDISKKYTKPMTIHIHVEVYENGKLIDPTNLIKQA